MNELTEMNRKKLVSIIIPAYNEEANIERLLLSIKNQKYKDIEAIVVDDGSKDKTVQIARKSGAKVYSRKHLERSRQRNFGARMARGDYFLFLDADMELTEDVVRECIELASKSKEIGAIIIPEESVAENYWEKVKAFERSFYNEDGDTTTDAARFFTRRAFEVVGGYDEKITGPEDWDLPDMIRKAGFEIGRVMAVIKHYERIKGPLHVAKKKFYYGLKTHRYLKKHGVPWVGPKTVYFLRPVFYKKYYKLLQHPLLSVGLFVMLTFELFFGGAGFLIGKIQNR